MALSTQPYKGTRDFYPDDMRIQRWMFGKMREVVELYGYQEYDGPMLEPFERYAAKTGEEIVNQQLYWLMVFLPTHRHVSNCPDGFAPGWQSFLPKQQPHR